MAERRALRQPPKQIITHAIGTRSVGSTRRADADATQTVTVACKIPNGLILKTYHWAKDKEQTPNGVRDIDVAVQDPEVFHVKGPALPFGKMPAFQIKGGFALTRGIPRPFWDKWLEANKDADYVRSGLIFACTSRGDAEQEARSRKDMKSGLEPLDPDNLPREFKKIKTATKGNDDADTD